MAMTLSSRPTKPRDSTKDEQIEAAQKALVRALTRFPIVSQTLKSHVFQPGVYAEEVWEWGWETPDPEADGKPYLSLVPRYLGGDSRERYYLTRFKDVLQPFFAPVEQKVPRQGVRGKEEDRLVKALRLFPILSPTLIQGATGSSQQWWKRDLQKLIKEGIIQIWHPDLLVEHDVEAGEMNIGTLRREQLKHDVTARGVRYFLAENAEALKVFLVRW